MVDPISNGYLWMAAAGIIATLAASFRNLPLDLAVWLRDRVLLSVDVGSEDPLFQWVSVWLAEQKYAHKARHLTASTDVTKHLRPNTSKIETSTPQIFFTPAPGHHIFRYKGRWIWLLRTRKEVGDDSVPSGSIILLEDIDAVFDKREKVEGGEQNRLSFSGLLNALDGAASKEGLLVFMTTNHKDKLDPALIRKGRADVHIEFGLSTQDQANNMHRAFFPGAALNGFGSAAVARQLTMAEVQEELLSLKI